MTPKEAHILVTEYDGINIVERDLNPENEKMGRAQFLVSFVYSKEEVQRYADSVGLELFTDSAPDGLSYITLPPQ